MRKPLHVAACMPRRGQTPADMTGVLHNPYSMKEIDREIFLLINATNEANDVLTILACFAAKYLILAVPFGITLLWIAGKNNEKKTSLSLLTAVAIAVLSSWIIGLLFPVERPFLEPIGHNLLAHRPSPSFPSNHGLVMFTCAWSLLLMSYKWQAALTAVSGLLVAWSRIYLGIHWPSDMMGALLIAYLAALAARLIDHFAGKKILSAALWMYETFLLKPLSNIGRRLM